MWNTMMHGWNDGQTGKPSIGFVRHANLRDRRKKSELQWSLKMIEVTVNMKISASENKRVQTVHGANQGT